MAALPERPPGFEFRPHGAHAGALELQCEGAPLTSLAARYGTPLYVYSHRAITGRYRAFHRAFGKIPHTVCYSVKANSNLAILRLLGEMGCGFDVVSGGELQRVLRAWPAAAKRVVFSGVGKREDEIDLALRAGILLFNAESESEVERLAARAAALKRRAPIALRVNPDVPAETHPYIATGMREHKFGIAIADARQVYELAAHSRWLNVAGVSVHIGSQITALEPFALAMARVADLVGELRGLGMRVRYVDAGGGLGIAYNGADGSDFDAMCASYAAAVSGPLAKLGVRLLLEPGRSILGPAGVLLTRVLYRKRNGRKQFLVVDAAMNDLIRPALYNAHHEIVPVVALPNDVRERFDVVGPVCESGDFFARDRELPQVAEGDLLALLDAGAYGMSLASNYNTRPRPAEVLVEGNRVNLIRKRESAADLWRAERM